MDIQAIQVTEKEYNIVDGKNSEVLAKAHDRGYGWAVITDGNRKVVDNVPSLDAAVRAYKTKIAM